MGTMENLSQQTSVMNLESELAVIAEFNKNQSKSVYW